MKAKSSYSDLDDRAYVGKVLTVAGFLAGVASLSVAWPALSNIGLRLIS